MMKYTQALNVAVAGILVVPAVTLQAGGSGSLRHSLDGTLQALETLAGIERRLVEVVPGAVQEIVAHTEPALPVDAADPGASDRLLERLRDEVGRLQLRVDQAERAHVAAGGEAPVPGPTLPIDTDPSHVHTTGLSDAMRARLARGPERPLVKLPSEASRAPTGPISASEADEKTAFEDEGFAADPLRLAQAYYRKGEFARAVELLEEQAGPEALYWKARSLEKTGEHEAAIEAYARVSEMEDAGPLAGRALEDIEFLRWRLEFEGKRKPR